MAYAEYSYYTGTYQGFDLPEGQFAYYAEKASAYLDNITLGAAPAYAADNAVKNACCAVAEAYYETRQGGGVASEKAGDYSVSYVNGISKAPTEAQRLYRTAALYLAEKGLLHRGVKA